MSFPCVFGRKFMTVLVFWLCHFIMMIASLLYKTSFLEIIWKSLYHGLWLTILSMWAHFSVVLASLGPRPNLGLHWKDIIKWSWQWQTSQAWVNSWVNFVPIFHVWVATLGLILWLMSCTSPLLQSLGSRLVPLLTGIVSLSEHLVTTFHVYLTAAVCSDDYS